MSVLCRKGIWYVAYYPDGKYGKYVRLKLEGVADRATALHIESLLKQKTLPVQQAPADLSIESLWDGYNNYIRMHRQKSTAVDVRISGEHFCKAFPGRDVTTLSPALLEFYKEIRKAKGVSNRTINKELAWFSGFLKWCGKRGVAIPDLRVEPLPYKRPLPVILTMDECMALIRQAPLHLKAFLSLLYFAGMRLREVSSLRWKDINWQEHTVLVVGKGGGYRVIPLHDVVMSLLESLPAGNNDSHIFQTKHATPLYHIRQTMKRLAVAVGITKNVYPHLLRHSFATHAVGRGVNLEIIRSFLGHRDIDTTTLYTTLAVEHLKVIPDGVELSRDCVSLPDTHEPPGDIPLPY